MATLVPMLAANGCGAGAPAVVRLGDAARPVDTKALAVAVEGYYQAAGAKEMRAAVAAALAVGPDAAPALEVAADLAFFEDRRFDRFDTLYRALLDPKNDNAVLHLHWLNELDWTVPEGTRLRPLLEAIVAEHRDFEARAVAAWMLADMAHYRGRFAERDAALATLGLRLPWAVIGTWDNDQGKGFDVEAPPERQVALEAHFPGKLVDVSWRTDPVLDPRGHVDLGGLMDPARWQLAYLATAARVDTAGAYELHVSTTDPIKIWVNDMLVFQVPAVAEWLPEGFVIPVTLRAGVNRVLVKQAHEDHAWLFSGRLTGPGAAPVTGVSPVPADTPYADGASAGPGITVEDQLARRVRGMPAGSARRAFLESEWAERMGLRVQAVARAEAFVAAYGKSLTARYQLAGSRWDNQERGTTSDLLAALARETGADFPWIRLQLARFWRQQNLGEQARAELMAVRAAFPDRPSASLSLADVFDSEGWQEDRCEVLRQVDARFPDWPEVKFELGDCLEELRFYPEATALYRQLLAQLPNSITALQRLHWQAQGDEDFPAALGYARQMAETWPHLRASWERWGETLRRSGQPVEAEARLRHLIELAPTASVGYARLGDLQYQRGQREAALTSWRRALDRDPEDEKLAHRLDFLAPDAQGPWMAEVPTPAELDAIVQHRSAQGLSPAADVHYLLDDEVTALRADGSTVNFVTEVAYAVNDAGRDRLTHQSLRSDGRARVLQAYAVDEAGKRTDASTIRGRSVRFRQLSVGSTVVLQYRLDSAADGYLASHLARQWWFSGPASQTQRSRWVLYAPKGTALLESQRGEVERKQSEVGALVRTSWEARNLAPLVPEPSMPTLHEAATNLVISTVPDWDMFVQWEASLLKDAFRVGPDVEALAQKLLGGTQEPAEKVARIQEWLMDDIRYQQDYEGFIAGVKPHAAPVVLARRYGDCKDKAVLFITLAHLAGIEAHFALVRTRDAGPVVRDVPMQQFNHAIVYVPAQAGIPEGRFFDPTVELLDIPVLRHDDQGTWSLVLDPAPFLAGGKAKPDARSTFTWRQIPYQDAGLDTSTVGSVLRLTADGAATGEMTMTAQGRVGSSLRRAARNTEQLTQMLQQQIGGTFAGARVSDVKPIALNGVRAPAALSFSLSAPSAGRREGDELRLKVPVGWNASSYFTLGERRYPLILGAPRTLVWTIDVEAPENAKVKRLPKDAKIASPCLTFERTLSATNARVKIRQSVIMTCERIPAEAYAAQRQQAEEIQRQLDEDIVFTIPKAKPGK